MKKTLKPIFYISTLYSFVALPNYAVKTGGTCNAGILIFGLGLFLIITSGLTFFAMKNNTKVFGKLSSVLSLLIWGFFTITSTIEDSLAGLIYFLPFFITTIMVTTFSYIGQRTTMTDENTIA